jgi:PadR family transcriptional regulator AphA
MRKPLPATSYAVLGMLSLSPMSGYELNQNVDKSIANFWQISKSQVYGELSRLEQLGLVRSTEVEQERLPDKRTYQLTDAGAAALDDWLSAPGHGPRRLRSGLLLKTFFAHRMDGERFVRLLEEYRGQAEVEREYLAEVIESLDPSLPETFYSRATALYGLRQAETALAWIDEVKKSLPKPRTQPLSADVYAAGAREKLKKTPARRSKTNRS